MEINKEQFNKLSRIEKIEYRLDKNEVDNNLDFINWIMIGCKYYVFFAFISLAIFYSTYEGRLELSISLIKIGLLALGGSFIMGIIDEIFLRKKSSKLFNKYFEIKPKEEKHGRERS